MTETLVLQSPLPWRLTERAKKIEAMGFNGVVLSDSQNMRPDMIVAATVALQSTTDLLVGPGVTNPFTRHPAVLAGAFATLQRLSGGRATLQIGRGDSSLAYIGLAPAPLKLFEDFVRAVQAYLGGEEVEFQCLPAAPHLASVDQLGLGDAPKGSRLKWLDASDPKVPVGVAASGPKVIAAAARLADQVNLSVGADPARLRWGVETARQARAAAGLEPDDLEIGAWINIAVHEDRDRARELGAGRLAGALRFSAMHGALNGPANPADRAVLEEIPGRYSMNTHGERTQGAESVVPDDVAHRHGVFGPAGYCVERLSEIADLGIRRLFLIPPGEDQDPDGSFLRVIGEQVVGKLRLQ